MSPPLSPLAETVASLRVATLATPAHAWVPEAIHALILACLVRLFGRLEEMIRLWQAGLLPPPPAPRPHLPRTAVNPEEVHYRARQAPLVGHTANPRLPPREEQWQAHAAASASAHGARCTRAGSASHPVETTWRPGYARIEATPACHPAYPSSAAFTRRHSRAPPPLPARSAHNRHRRRTPISLRNRIYLRVSAEDDIGSRSVRHSSPVRRST